MNCKDEHGWTALPLAIEDGREAVVQQLLERRADLDANCRGKRGRAALWSAAASGLVLYPRPARGVSLHLTDAYNIPQDLSDELAQPSTDAVPNASEVETNG